MLIISANVNYFSKCHFISGPRPSSPINVSAVSSEGMILIKWQPPFNTSVKILSYHIEYNTGDDWVHAGSTRATEDTSFQFSSLTPGTTYSFRVISHGLLANSVPSAVVSFSVPEGNQPLIARFNA